MRLYNGKVERYKADKGERVYLEHRKNCCGKYKALETVDFLKYTVKHFTENGWSLDACVGRAIESGEFRKEQTVCTKTLYNYVDNGLLPIKNVDLPEKLK